MKLSIIIPVFNEQSTIDQVLRRVTKINLSGYKKEIVVVDDASDDETQYILRKWEKKVRILRHKYNIGKGASVRDGIIDSSGDLVLIQDADLEYDPKYYGELIKPFEKKTTVVVFGTRLTNYPLRFWGKDKTILPMHLIANRFLTALTNILFGGSLTDMETGYKVFRKEILDKIKLNSEGFDFEAEVTAKLLKRGIRIVEVPIITKPRTYQEGKKIGWQDGLIAVWTIIKYRFID